MWATFPFVLGRASWPTRAIRSAAGYRQEVDGWGRKTTVGGGSAAIWGEGT